MPFRSLSTATILGNLMFYAKLFLRLLIVVGICGAAYLLYRAFNRYSIAEILDAIRSIPPGRFAAALGFAAASYGCLTMFDFLAVRYAGKPLAYRRTALASFVSLSIGHNIGIAALSSGAIRYRFYSRWGLGAEEVAKVIVFSGLTVGLGLLTLGGIGLLLYPADAESLMGLGGGAVMAIAVMCLALPGVYLLLAAFVRKPLEFRKWSLQLPTLPFAAAQIGIGTLNFACVAACLHQLLSAFTEIAYLKTAAIYVLANGAALVSHVPGGLGVLEGAVLYLLPEGGSLGALVAFRLVYFFVPGALGVPLFLISEYALHGQQSEPSKEPAE